MSNLIKSLHLWLPALVTLFAAVIGGIFLVIAKIIPEQPARQFQAVIEEPRSGQIIEHNFDVVVKVDNVPEDYHLWVAVGIKDLYWFKQPEVNRSNHSSVINLDEINITQKSSFSLCIIKVPSRGQSVITDWFLKGKKTGKYPGIKITEIPDAAIVDLVHGLKFAN